MKIFVCRVFGFIRGVEYDTHTASANSYAEILYEVAEAVSGFVVHTAAYAPG